MDQLEQLYQEFISKGDSNPDPTKLSALNRPQAELLYLLLMLDFVKQGGDLNQIPYGGIPGKRGGCSFELGQFSESSLKLLSGFTS